MRMREACTRDTECISTLILSLSGPFLTSPDGEGAEPFVASVGAAAIAGYVAAENFDYRVVYDDAGELVVIAALRDNKHLFHLFVAPAHQGKGLGRRLWHALRDAALAAGNPGEFSVNASLNALPVYAHFGFVAQGEVMRTHGIAFQPMRFRL